MLTLDLSKLAGVVSQDQISAMAPEVEAAHAKPVSYTHLTLPTKTWSCCCRGGAGEL